MVYDDDTGRRIHQELDDDGDYPHRPGPVRVPSQEIQQRIIALADVYGWRAANRIHADLNAPGVTVEAVRHVLDQFRPKRTPRP